MGYQESFVTTTNKKYFNDFLDRIKKLGWGFYDAHLTYPTYIVNVKENVYGEFTKKRIMLKKNKKYVYFTGDRHLQRSANNVLDIADNEETVLNLDIIEFT